MPTRSARAILLLSVAALPMAPSFAQAGEAAAPSVVELAPVVVDARQWREDAARVPAAVEVLGRDRMDSPLWDSVAAVAKVTPNVQIEQSSVQTKVVMRGMTSANTQLQDPVGYFVNDVALPHGASQAPQMFDTRQVEILKGPQGSLYGRNTEAGALKVTTADPDWQPSAWAEFAPSAKNGRDGWEPAVVASGRVSGPVVDDRVAASLAVRGESAKGVHANLSDGADDGGKVDRWTVSTGVTALAGDDTEVTVKSLVEQSDQGKQRMRYLTGANATPRYATNYSTKSWDDNLTSVQSGKVVHHLGAVDLTSVTGWTHYTRDFQMDLDAGPLPGLPTTLSHQDDALSQEVRLASADRDAPLRWLGGLYTYREWTDLEHRSGTPSVRRATAIDQTGVAAFGQVEVSVTDRLRAGLGSRVEWIGQEGRQTFTSATANRSYQEDLEQVTVLPRFSLSYDVQPRTMLYGSYARGYLPGGYNFSTAAGADSFTYQPEYSWTAEMGAKSRFAEDRLGTRVALFHTVTKDKQILDLLPGGTQKVSNAARAEIYGAELGADAKLSERWSAFGSAGVQHAEATSYTANVLRGASLVATDLSGSRLPMAASATYSLGVRYDEGEGWFGQASANGSSPYYFDSQNTLKQSAFVTMDAEIGYRFATFEVSLWAANLFDENVYSRAVRTPAGTIVEDGDPREVGLRVKAAW